MGGDCSGSLESEVRELLGDKWKALAIVKEDDVEM